MRFTVCVFELETHRANSLNFQFLAVSNSDVHGGVIRVDCFEEIFPVYAMACSSGIDDV